MLLVAWKGVLARKLRLVLTSVAIVLGVGFVSGAFFLTDSMRASFDSLFTEAAQGIDVQVQPKVLKDLAKEQQSKGPGAVPIDLAKVGTPPEIIDRIKELPGTKLVAGTIFQLGAQPLDKHGDPISTGGAPSFAANWDPDAEDVGALNITRGSAPDADEVMLDKTTMERGKFHVGDKLRVLIQGGRKTDTFTISGVVKFGKSNSLNGASITVFQTQRIQDLLDMGDNFTAVDVQAKDGVTQATLKRQVKQALGPKYDVITGEEFTQEQTDSIDSAFLNVLQNVILGFAAVAVFVGAFTIFNTFTILVGQRTREFGLLRAIGAGRGQVLDIVVLEAILTGIVASTLGIFAGYGVAALLRGLINSFAEAGIPNDPFPLHARTVIVSYAVGVVITLIASVVPAWRASRLSPLEALRTNSAAAGRGWKSPVFGALLCLIGAALIVHGFRVHHASTSTVLSNIGGGFALGIIGIALLSRLFIIPVTRLLGMVLGRSTTGELAKRNVLRNRARSATTSSALMIGLALASLVLVFHASLQETVNHEIDQVLNADIFVFNSTALQSGVGVVEQDTVDKIAKVKGVDQYAAQRAGSASAGKTFDPGGDLQTFVAFNDGTLDKGGIVELEVRSGTSDPGDGLLVDSDFAKKQHWKSGQVVKLAFSGDITRDLKINGIFKPNDIVGASLIASPETFDAVQPPQQRAPAGLFIRVQDGVPASTVVKRIKHSLGKDASFLEIQDTEALRDTFNKQLAPILGLVLGMLSLSLIIALFGIGNTLALNVFERTREIGLVRAVGGTRWQLRWMIVIEAVLVALFGAIVGVLVGVGAGWALIRALHGDGFLFGLNIGPLIGVLLAGFVAGVLAALLPARRAAKTDILAAIATE
jgi:putative ABC transport system permease protein